VCCPLQPDGVEDEECAIRCCEIASVQR
jgi:hypothetical protein